MEDTVETLERRFAKLGLETRIGQILLEQGKITREDADRILALQELRNIKFGEAAQELGLVSEADIRHVLARQFCFPYLGKDQNKISAELLAAHDPTNPMVEILRAVRSQLLLRWFTKGRRAIVVAGLDSTNDASYIAANLAIVFSQLGSNERALLVDGNMRFPRQHKLFGISNKYGVSDVLANRATLGASIENDVLENLSVLVAGTVPPNPQELLNRAAFTGVVGQVNDAFDVTIFDVPPLTEAADALLVSATVGGVLLVVRKNFTRQSSLATACQQLREAGVEVVGTMMVSA